MSPGLRRAALLMILGGLAASACTCEEEPRAGSNAARRLDASARDAADPDATEALDAEVVDAAEDAGPLDAEGIDAGHDAGVTDAFVRDAHEPDAHEPDAFTPDAFTPDAFTPDAFTPDASAADASPRDAGVPDSGPAGPEHIHIFVSNTCDLTVSPPEASVPHGQRGRFEWHNHSVDYPVDVWLSYGGGYLDLEPGATWDEPVDHCLGPNAHDEYADISAGGCASYRFFIHCL